MVMMKGLKGMAMMKPQSLIPFRNASASAIASPYNPRDDRYHLDMINLNEKTFAYLLNKAKEFSLIRNDKEQGNRDIRSRMNLEKGMVLFKNYVSVSEQVEIVNTCQKFGMGPGGFYRPVTRAGRRKNFQMMCFGRNWDPITRYDWKHRSDGSEAPPIPNHLLLLAVKSILRAHDSYMPLMDPDICIVKFYTTTIGKLRLRQDRDEGRSSLEGGLPVVSVTIGDSVRFVYSYTGDMAHAKEITLQSGDVLIFGGESRHIYHGIKKIIPESAPFSLLQQTNLVPGSLNLTFKDYSLD
ncbi:DNA N(6)-methyladenine demethylase ALKBH1D-like [Rutidosis leptorrhynchoides]|uniref:DNA N(6)-methyladenine demethylase ALKBH1D-like n=1 Tax=Rutidosis leptorrhynchoides TaxID=125765 RepID=UPI003A9A3384